MQPYGGCIKETGEQELTATLPGPSRRPALAGAYELRKASTINDLLTSPAPVLPFEVGVFSQFLARLRPDVSKVTLRRAIGAYASARGYLQALAEPGAMRHDIDGVARSPVSSHHKAEANQRAERPHDAQSQTAPMSGLADNSVGLTIH